MPSVLFVCTGNICRSPMAWALLKRRMTDEGFQDGWQVGSAGTWAGDGFPPIKEVQELLAEKGMDVSQHRSRIVDLDMLRAADLILTMEDGHKEAIQVEFPEVADRVYMLSEMVGVEEDVRDPIGGSMMDYQEAIQVIEDYIERGFEKIVRLADQGASAP